MASSSSSKTNATCTNDDTKIIMEQQQQQQQEQQFATLSLNDGKTTISTSLQSSSSSFTSNTGGTTTTAINEQQQQQQVVIIKELEQLLQIVNDLDIQMKMAKSSISTYDTTASSTTTTNAAVAAATTTATSTSQYHHHSQTILSHYSKIPKSISEIYDLLYQGANLIHSTSTKYTLLKSSPTTQHQIAKNDLIKGCQILSTACYAIVICNTTTTTTTTTNSNNNATNKNTNTSNNTNDMTIVTTGLCSTARTRILRSVRSILTAVIHLVRVFDDTNSHDNNNNNNIGAPETGIVWECCNVIINKQLPVGNRNSIRRDLLTYMKECNDTIQEFQTVIDLGPKSTSSNNNNNHDADNAEEDDDDDFDNEDDEQYTDQEIPIVKACLGIILCSKNCIHTTLSVLDELGNRYDSDNSNDNNNNKNEQKHEQQGIIIKSEQHLLLSDQIIHIHDKTCLVGIGITDLGSLLYPPIIPTMIPELYQQIQYQSNLIQELLCTILTPLSSTITTITNDDSEDNNNSEEVTSNNHCNNDNNINDKEQQQQQLLLSAETISQVHKLQQAIAKRKMNAEEAIEKINK